MGKWLEKYAGSIRFWVLVLVSVYLGYALYFAVYGLQFSLQLTSDRYVYRFGDEELLVVDYPLLWQRRRGGFRSNSASRSCRFICLLRSLSLVEKKRLILNRCYGN